MSRPTNFWSLPYTARMHIDGEQYRRGSTQRDVSYWRDAYESLVKQTGRDLNDGLGLDPRKVRREG